MNQLPFADYREYYASECKICLGSSYVIENEIYRECVCQKKARRKYRLEQIDIYPPELKYKSWTDFSGVIFQESKVVGNLKIESVINARDKAFEYCFGVSFDKNILQNKAKHLKIHKHLNDGQNVIIVGDEKTGKSLLGALICKEVANAAFITNKDFDYRWVKFYDIINAARWVFDYSSGVHKPVNHSYLDMLADLDFLFIDGVDVQRGKNYPVDHVAMDSLFGARTLFQKPTIIICSKKILQMLNNHAGQEQIVTVFGNEFLQIFRKNNTLIIELTRDEST